MIEIEILSSSDPFSKGTYKFEFDSVYIGRSKKSDIIFLDKELPLNYITIEIYQGQLVIKNYPKSPFYFINGKKISGGFKLKIGDQINFGKHVLKIISFESTESSLDFNLDIEFSDVSVKPLVDLLNKKLEKLEKT